MKTTTKTTFLVLLFLGFVHVVKSQEIKFRIDARIDGMEQGDTLKFSKVTLPQWTFEPGFDVIVEEVGYATYQGTLDHTQYFLMEYKPMRGEVPATRKRGMPFLLSSGTTTLTGTRDYIYDLAVESELYDKQLQKILALQDSLSRIDGDIIRNFFAAQKNNDSVEMRKILTARDNGFDSLHRMQDEYNATTAGEFAAMEMVRNSGSNEPVEELKKCYESLSPAGKNSYYGQLVAEIIVKKESLTPGKTAPDVDLITVDGRKIKISDFRGKYLLIYHFGGCPGSLQIDSLVAELYNNNSEKLDVLGFTESLEGLKSWRDSASAVDEILGINIKRALNGMLAHPWKNEVEIPSGNNAELLTSYYALGLPYFIFISPDGKIIARAGGDNAFNVAVKTLAGDE